MKEKFTGMKSEISWPLTYFAIGLVWFSIILIIGVIVLLFYTLFEYDFTYYLQSHPDRLLVIVILEPILIFLCIVLMIHVVKAKKRYFHRVVVDETGVHVYNNTNDLILQTLYTELCKSDDMYVPDISSKIHSNPKLRTTLRIFKKDKTGETIEQSIDFNYYYFVIKNKYDLYRHFLQGVEIFRPDLKIGQRVRDQFQLPSETLQT
ncbi:hypothetical protein CLU96_1984 [Chryseobacterium sp. 52]|uniref:hypothetical protein n=1 Tax=Chryseobacterium sp. 52 TaxID=2035213 RepID=UPI000C174EF9|nr:hypothetical protein [Chryseobacterium sp. 52]PIF44985.1 hypothetical protein CLU96_1984 [Chryseobacterium sp. 52]